jgi:hypothetical protein
MASARNAFSRADGALGVFLVRGGPAEIRQDAITHVAGDKPVVARDDIAAEGSIRMQQAPQLFGVKFFTQRRRAHQVAEHHGELATFAEGCCHLNRCNAIIRIRFDIGCRHQLGDRIAYAQPVAGTGHADVLQHLVIDAVQQVHLDVVCLKGVGILAEANSGQPGPDIAHGVSSSSSAFASFKSGASKPSVNQL